MTSFTAALQQWRPARVRSYEKWKNTRFYQIKQWGFVVYIQKRVTLLFKIGSFNLLALGGLDWSKKASHSVIFSLPALKTPANQPATPPAFISTWCLKVKPLPGQIIHWLTGRLPKNHTFLLAWVVQGQRHCRGTFLIWGVWHQARHQHNAPDDQTLISKA